MHDFYYTIMAPQQQEEEKALPQARLVCYKGVHLYAAPYDEENYQIVQLCSTNPKDFLRQDIAPGTLIPLIKRV